jgi:methyl-accepting chemotaxis protein
MSNQRDSQGVTLGSFFRYHGWLSPGVRLFRLISFPAKAAWIALAFCAPLFAMLWLLWSSANTQIDSTRSELQGMSYLQPLTQFLGSAHSLRRAAILKEPGVSDALTNATAAMAKLEKMNSELGGVLGVNASFSALKTAYQALAQSPVAPNPDSTFAAHTVVIDAAMDLLAHVADGSQLSLDPELDTYHLMNLAVMLGQQELESLAQLRELGTLTLSTKDTKEAPSHRVRAMIQASSLIVYLDKGFENSYKLSVETFPEVAKAMNMAAVDKARESFLDALAKQVLIDAPTAETGALVALGNASYDTQARLNQMVEARLTERLQSRIQRLQKSIFLEMLLSLASVCFALYLMLSFYRVMMGGLKEVSGHLKQITAGNLTTAPKPWGSDEAAQLMTTMGEMQSSLRRMASAVLESAAGVQTASEEIASASQDLSRRTEASASSLQETSSNMETIAQNTKHTVTMVGGTTAIVSENADAATRGAEVIRQVVGTMEGIRNSSNQIGEIIGVIDGIAFQTNILALNAAVEAARAGEQGRGFAVVASEVRALAGRSAAAAKEIKTLISKSIAQVEAGNEVVKTAGSTIEVIVVNADQVNALMKEISVATQEQDRGVTAVESAIHNLDQSIQQNAALVEQTSASASTLAEQAQRLAEEVSFFKLR